MSSKGQWRRSVFKGKTKRRPIIKTKVYSNCLQFTALSTLCLKKYSNKALFLILYFNEQNTSDCFNPREMKIATSVHLCLCRSRSSPSALLPLSEETPDFFCGGGILLPPHQARSEECRHTVSRRGKGCLLWESQRNKDTLRSFFYFCLCAPLF